jgi:hypothetical protein
MRSYRNFKYIWLGLQLKTGLTLLIPMILLIFNPEKIMKTKDLSHGCAREAGISKLGNPA